MGRSTDPDSQTLPPPAAVRKRATRLGAIRDQYRQDLARTTGDLERVRTYLKIAPAVSEALDVLSEALFERTIRLLEEKLTIALQEVLEQPIVFKTDRSFKRGAASIDFAVERGGEEEHVLKGQGGSVANVLSVGLRMFALTTLDPKRHRRFLVLDEQDCWLRPDLVPRLVRIVHLAGRELGFQTLMISHHDVAAFQAYADRIYAFVPGPDGVEVVQRDADEA